MQTVSSLCDRLGKAPDWAVERLRFMLIEVDGPASKIDDDTCDLLIECSDDPEVAEKVRNRKLGDANKEKEKEEKRRAAAKKGAETRRAKAASARAEKIAAEAKTAEPAKDGPHPVAEIVRGDNANAGVVLPEVKLPPPPKKPVAKPVPAPKKKVAENPRRKSARRRRTARNRWSRSFKVRYASSTTLPWRYSTVIVEEERRRRRRRN